MNRVDPIKDKQKIFAIKNYIKSDDYIQDSIYKEFYQARDYTLFVWGINTACRVSDLLSLKIKDVMNSQGNIGKYLYLKPSKTKKKAGNELKIFINDSMKKSLEKYIKQENCLDPDDYLFKTKTGNKLDRIRVHGLIKKWAKAVGIEQDRISAHSLRKTWGYMAWKQGVSIQIISQKLGHNSEKVTRRYIGVDQEAVNDIEKLICL
jgi:integrase